MLVLPTIKNIYATASLRICILAVVALCAVATVAVAQTDPRTPEQRLERIERELLTMQRYVFQGQRGGAKAGALPPPAIMDEAAATNQELRLTQLEQALAELTGKIEQLQFQQQQSEQTMQRFMNDVEQRLNTPPSNPSSPPVPAVQNPVVPSPVVSPPPPSLPTAVAVPPADPSAVQNLTQMKPGENSAANVIAAAKNSTNAGAQQLYDQSLNELRRNDYVAAEKSLTQFLQQYPNDVLAENARYWLGESYYVRGQFKQAASAFLAGYQAFPKGAKAPDALLKLGMSLSQLNNIKEACQTFARLLSQHASADPATLDRAKSERQRLSCAN